MGLFTCCFGGPAAAGHSSGPHPDASTARDAASDVSQPASSGVRFIASHENDAPPLESADACTASDNSADTQSRSLELTNELEPTMHGPSYAGVWRGRSVAVRYLRLPSTMLEPALDLSLQHPHVVQTLRLRPVASCQQGTGQEENRALLSQLPPKVKKLAEKLLLGEELMEVVTEHCSWGSLHTALQADASPPKQQQSPPADLPSSAANHGRHASPAQPQPAASATDDRQLAVSLLRCASLGAQAAAGPPIINSSSTTTDRLLAVLQTAADVARGMHYLHSSSRVHGSLRPATVLLAPGGCSTRRFQAKVADQGLPDRLPLPPPPPLRRPTQLAQQQPSRTPADGPPDSPQPSQPATSLPPDTECDTECDTYDTTTGVFHTAASTVAAIVAAETAAGRPGNAGWGLQRNGSRSNLSQGSPCRTSYDPGSDSSPSCTPLPTPAAEGALLQGEGAGQAETGPGPSSCRATGLQQEQGRMAGQGRTQRPVAGPRQAGDDVALPPSSSGSGDRDGGSWGEAGPAPPAPPPTHSDNPRRVSFLTIGEQQAQSSAAERSSSEEETAAAGPAAGRGEVAGGGDPHRPAVYRAPEAWGGACTAACDVWSFGVLLHCLATGGAAPYPGLEDEQVMRGVTSGILQLQWSAGVHPQVRQLCLSCLELNPELRPDFSLITTFLDKLVAKFSAAQQGQGPGQGPHPPAALPAPADLSPSTFSPPSHHQRESLTTTTTTTTTTPLPTRTYSPDAITAATRSSRDKSTEMVSIGAAVSAAVQVPPPSTKHPVAWEEALASLQTAMRQQQKLSQGRAAHWQGTCSTVFSSTNSSQSQQPSSSGAVRGCSSQSQQPSSSGAVGGHGCRQPGGRGSEAGRRSGGTAPELTTVGSSPQSRASPHQHRQLFLQQQQQQWQQQQQQQRPVFQQQQQQQELLSQSESDAGVHGPPCPPLCHTPSLTAAQLTPPNPHLPQPPGYRTHPPPRQPLATPGQLSQALAGTPGLAPAPPLPLLGTGSSRWLLSPPAPASLCPLPSQQSSDSMALPAGVPLPQPAWPAAPELLAGPPPLTLDPAPVVGDAAGQAEGKQSPAGVDPELLAFWGMATKQPSSPLPSPLSSLGLVGTPSPAESGSLVVPGPPSLTYHTHPPKVHTPPHTPHAGLCLGGGAGGGLSSSVGPHLLGTLLGSGPLSPALSSELGSDPGLATELHSLAAAAARQLSELMGRDREGKAAAAAGAAAAAAAARQSLGSRSWQVRGRGGQPPGPLAAAVARQRSRTLAALSATRADQSWSSPLLLLRSPLSLPDPSSPPSPATLVHSCQDIPRTITSSSVGGLEQGRGSCTSGNGSGQQQGQQPWSALHSSGRGSVATSERVSSDVTADVPEGEEHDQVGGLEAFPPVGRSHRTRSSSRRHHHHHHAPPPKAVRLCSPVICPPHPPSVPPPLPPPVHLHPTSALQPAMGVASTTSPEGPAPASPTSRPCLIRLSHPGPPPPLVTSTPQLSVLTPGPGPSRLSAPGSVQAAGQSTGGSWTAAGPTSSLQHTITSWQGAGAPRQPPCPPALLADSHGPAALLAGMQAQSPSQPHPARASHIPPQTGHTSLPLHTSLPKPHRTLVLHQLPGLPAAAAAAGARGQGQGQGRLRPAWPTGPDLSPAAPPYRSAPATTHQGTQAWAGHTVGGQGPPGAAAQALPGDARFSSSPAAGGHISWAALVPELEEEGPPSGAGT